MILILKQTGSFCTEKQFLCESVLIFEKIQQWCKQKHKKKLKFMVNFKMFQSVDNAALKKNQNTCYCGVKYM